MSGCLVDGEDVGSRAAMAVDAATGSDEELWADWEDEDEAEGGVGVGDERMGDAEKIAVRLADNYWDLEGLALAFRDKPRGPRDEARKARLGSRATRCRRARRNGGTRGPFAP